MTQKFITRIVGDACPECPNGLLGSVSNIRRGDVQNLTGLECRSCGYQKVDVSGFQRLVDAKKRGFKIK